MDISGKKIVLTGAAGGIGSVVADKLAEAGAVLLLVGRAEQSLETLCTTLPGSGHRVIAADVGTSAGRARVMTECASGVDVLVNNAGVNHFGLLEQHTDEQLQQMFAVNVLAPVLLSRDLIPLLRQSRGGIVNIGSGFGCIGFAGYCGYSASKFALRGFTEALRRELSGSGITVQYLAPRAVETKMNPPEVVAMNKQLGNATDSPAKVAAELLTLLQSGRPMRQMGRPERFFGRLNSLFPGVVDSALAKKLGTINRYAVAANDQAS